MSDFKVKVNEKYDSVKAARERYFNPRVAAIKTEEDKYICSKCGKEIDKEEIFLYLTFPNNCPNCKAEVIMREVK